MAHAPACCVDTLVDVFSFCWHVETPAGWLQIIFLCQPETAGDLRRSDTPPDAGAVAHNVIHLSRRSPHRVSTGVVQSARAHPEKSSYLFFFTTEGMRAKSTTRLKLAFEVP